MRSVIYIFIVSLLFISQPALGQEYKLFGTSDFNFYFQNEESVFIQPLDSILTSELAGIQKKLNYYTNKPIDVFVQSTIVQSADKSSFRGTTEGEITLSRGKVYIDVNQDQNSIARQFKLSAAQILIDEMMYGGTLQDKIKTANLVNLPSWVLPGLARYLSTNWSVEDDNSFRSLYDKYGIKDFNSIPAQFDDLKGASFWKFMEFKYGENAVPTSLYMSRLTRKFNTAIYYSFQTSLNDLFIDWKKYYSHAYEIDQKKPNPVDGISFAKGQLIDYVVLNDDEYYTLENIWKGKILYRNIRSTNTRERIYKLPNELSTTGAIGQGLRISNSKIYLALVAKSESYISLVNKNRHKPLYTTKKPITDFHFYKDTLYVLSSQLSRSVIIKVSKSNIDTLVQSKGYINSFSITGDKLTWVVSDQRYSVLVQKKQGTPDTVLVSQAPISQIIFASDSVVLYNSSENGIWNGKLLNLATAKTFNVTNYRSNISSHQYSDLVFVESIDQGDAVSIYITDHIKDKDFYIYKNIAGAYFSKELNEKKKIHVFENDLFVDSLESYSFQNPAYPSTDFQLSNYDSLEAAARDQTSFGVNTKIAPQLFSAHTAFLKLTNVPEKHDISGFEGSYALLLPRYLNIGAGISFANQFNTKSVSLHYLGVLQAGARDIGFSFISKVKKSELSIDLFHRKRTLFSDDFRTKYLTTKGSFELQKKINANLIWKSSYFIRNEKNIRLFTDENSLQAQDAQKWLSGVTSSLHLAKEYTSSSWYASLHFQPLVNLETLSWNISSELESQYHKNIGKHITYTHYLNAATSQGTAPIFYILGGRINDLLLEDHSREFATFKEPMLYDNKFGIRGFTANYRNGNTFATSTLDLSINLVNMVFKRPIAAEALSNVAMHLFSDIGTSFYGNSIYNRANTLNRRIIPSSAGSIVSTVNGLKNPLIASFGVGTSTRVYGYRIRLDYALGIEDQKFKQGILHLGIGSKF